MFKTTIIANTNPDGTITAVNSTITPDGVIIGGMPATHAPEYFDMLYGKSRITDICELTVMLDGVVI